jgi:hypothetical protein
LIYYRSERISFGGVSRHLTYETASVKRVCRTGVRQYAFTLKRHDPKTNRKYKKTSMTMEIPTFHHEEIQELYRHDLRIDPEILRKILTLPREPLILDLESVVTDSIRRFDFYQQKVTDDGTWKNDEMNFPLHALFLITELKAVEKLPVVLDLLRQSNDFHHFWFSDHTTETLWHFIYHLGSEQLELLISFMEEPASSYLGKWAVISGVTQMGLHHPERKEEIIHWYESLVDFYIENHNDPALADPEVVSNVICELCDLNAVRLLPKIEQLYKLDLVYTGIPGTYESVREDIVKQISHSKYQVFESIFDHYEHITTTWYGYMTEEQYAEKEAKKREEIERDYAFNPLQIHKPHERQPQVTFKRNFPKTGRNDPCPCGSGKKYKKCCMGK